MLVETLTMGAFEELSWRGLVHQTTAENMAEVLAKPLAVYSGFDPTAHSLHAGNLVPLMLLTQLRRARAPGPPPRRRRDRDDRRSQRPERGAQSPFA